MGLRSAATTTENDVKKCTQQTTICVQWLNISVNKLFKSMYENHDKKSTQQRTNCVQSERLLKST